MTRRRGDGETRGQEDEARGEGAPGAWHSAPIPGPRPLTTGPRSLARFLAVAALLALSLLVAAGLALSSQWARFSAEGEGARLEATPYLGVTYVQLSHDLAARYGIDADAGVLVTDVAGDSPARVAGLRRGDILLALDSTPLTRASSMVGLLLGRRPGDRVSLQVLRDGRTVTEEVVLGAWRR